MLHLVFDFMDEALSHESASLASFCFVYFEKKKMIFKFDRNKKKVK